MKKLIVLCSVLSTVNVFGITFDGQTYSSSFHVNDGMLYREDGVAYKCSTNATTVTLLSSAPAGWGGSSYFRTIEQNAFSGCSKLQSVTIPTSYQTFGKPGFKNCKSLSSVSLPYTLTLLPDEVFSGCTSLMTVALPSNLTGLPEKAFFGCTDLSDLTVPAKVATVGAAAFEGCSALRTLTFRCAPPDGLVESHALDSYPRIAYAPNFEDEWRAFSLANLSLKVSPVADLEYVVGQEPMVMLDFEVDGVDILYTTDGSDPLLNGRTYDGAFKAFGETRLRAVAAKDGLPWSGEVAIKMQSRDADAAITRFVQGTNGRWTVIAFIELGERTVNEIDASAIKVYAADTVDGLKDAEPMGEGVTVESLSSAVRVKLSIETPLDARRQFFKVGLGD